jgi:HSP20 family protein
VVGQRAANHQSEESTIMSVMRYEPWSLMNRLQRDFDRLLQQQTASEAEEQQSIADWVPPVDIREEDTQFVLHADLPGIEPKDIEVTLEKGVLTVRGKRTLAARDERAGFRRVERVSGAFYRRFALPDTADSHSVKARFANGVLEVVIPKQPQVMPRRITVETN